MLAVNMVVVGGTVRTAPSVFKTPKGTEVGSMVIAVETSYRTRDGEEKDKTTLIEVKFFGKQIEAYRHKFMEGAQILVEGELTSNSNREGKIFLAVLCKHSHFVGPPNRATQEADAAAESSSDQDVF